MKKDIVTLIHKYERIIIHRHCYPDLDALGSQAGLAELIKTTYPDKDVLITGKDSHKFTFLTRMDHVSDRDYYGSLAIVCDTDDEATIDDRRYQLADYLIKIDHHPNEDAYGDISWVEENASSVSEMIYELYEYGKNEGYRLTNKAAYLLYAGIIGDTGRFMYPNTTEKTLRIGSKLLAYTFSTNELFDQLNKVELPVARIKGYILQHFQITPAGIGFIKLDAKILRKLETTASEIFHLINVFSNVENIKIWVFFIEDSHRINVRVRSNSIVVNHLAKTFGGGGHAHSAGFALHHWEQAKTVLGRLETMCGHVEEEVL